MDAVWSSVVVTAGDGGDVDAEDDVVVVEVYVVLEIVLEVNSFAVSTFSLYDRRIPPVTC